MTVEQSIVELLNRQEPLCGELSACLQMGRMGCQGIYHPLVHEPLYSPALNAMYNAQLSHKKLAVERAKDSENWSQFVFLHERPYRLDAFDEIHVIMPPADYWELLSSVWIDSENIWQQQSSWLLFLTNRIGSSSRFMSKEERAYLKSLPDEFPIYRGCSYFNEEGISWTLNPEKAEWFAKRFAKPGGKVIKKVVKRKDCFAYLSRRNEDEIVYFKHFM